MAAASEQIRDTIAPFPANSSDGASAPETSRAHDGLFWRQIIAAGLEAVAEKVAAGGDLELDEALLLSRASLPLLGKIVELRFEGRDTPDTLPPGALPVERIDSRPGLRPASGQPLTDWESFCRTVIATRDEFSPRESAKSWYPILKNPLDRDSPGDGDFTGVDILRAIALARLVLPPEIEVRAPLGLLGPKVAQVALDFGASHLGYVALDGQTPTEPLVADATVFDELLGCCLPTSVREEPQ